MTQHIDVRAAVCPVCDAPRRGAITSPHADSDVVAWACDSCGEAWECDEVEFAANRDVGE